MHIKFYQYFLQILILETTVIHISQKIAKKLLDFESYLFLIINDTL